MHTGREVVVLSGVRTPVGNYGGGLKDFSPAQLGAMVIKEAVDRAGIAADEVGHVAFGHVLITDKHDVYLARVAAVNGGLPVTVPAVTVNRLCGSGLQAIVNAAQTILLGDADCTVAGGAESMSRGAYLAENHRWGQRLGNSQLVDMVTGGLSDPFADYPMGVTAENVAAKWNVSREDQDALAIESHRRAAMASAAGYFKEQTLPVEVKSRKGTVVVDHDEHIRTDVDLASMAKLRPVFQEGGTVTAGNSSGMNDAAAAVVLMERAVAERRGLRPMARLVGYSYAGVEPKYMGVGPVPAVKSLLERTGLTVDDLDVIELNEAFASQAIAVMRELGLPPDKTNPNGSGISIGHPISATGCILTVKALYELERTSGRYALVTMCIGGGQGIAAIFERL
ncbi:acetyl-CoA C-acyltransferase family protein [Mycobacterium sp. CBMA293]|uniref:acetyl-CoA C-acyltransferase family protein n=1 Tax=unclassified Mycolicibacterium TaxID=2636767 RepID=UPI0012DCE142|nr:MULTISPECIES: acetyl-CoA C-acyltransferase family protein [unclassified Mycolicibacterium]MUL49783.1 acetyl-CoA C-acyltransferase family protein [Mycolicibacterium sp. CBMA 360]MUL58553.1 acetyl-CoA C-acyltransferase family protein [Mycolicibacterium sp. CBMA 335]MUL74011.1 acetyl-CoA C-acyltransferase family protein [Mycolicibacterium sp. CBMA 311]MUL93436.1 acetyl-CoA C-acyltransferase family protein [Mycolicibacterium sp. CBMA 230]MUM04652.1 acetyl-CoA acetyltransferase [Mycolicibacteriu